VKLNPNNVLGVMPPLITPFDAKEELDEEALIREIRYHLVFGITGLILGGSTGEGATISPEELQRICRIAVQEVNGKIPVIAGIIPDSTKEAVKKGKLAKDSGVDGLMVTPTHYHIPTEDGIVEYYSTIGKDVGLPIIIYNVVPIVPLSADLIARLADVNEVVGIKQSIGDGSASPGGQVEILSEILERVGNKISVLASYDPLLFPGLALGAKGTIGAINTILPELCVQLFDAVQDHEIEKARELNKKIFPVSIQIKSSNWASRVKTAINLQGRDVGLARSPMMPISDEEKEEMVSVLTAAGVL
jgi:4-hydroxy-tetrahydrodipicolinate synthase